MRIGRYELGKRIATGGMGEVFHARMVGVEGFEKPIAVKRIFAHLSRDETYRRLFIREAKVTARLVHPNIAQVFELGEDAGQLFMAMELVDGVDLARIMDRLRRARLNMKPEVAFVVAFDVLEALDHAHSAADGDDNPLRLVHRDVSPQNILIERSSGFVKLCDFGVTRSATLPERQRLVGKLRYMSPEQARKETVDGRADLFSLGAVLFHALTGRHLFETSEASTLLELNQSGRIPRLREVWTAAPPAVADIVDQALQRDPDARFQTAAAFREPLESYLAERDPRAVRAELRDMVREFGDTLISSSPKQPPTVREEGTLRWQELATMIATEPPSATRRPAHRPARRPAHRALALGLRVAAVAAVAAIAIALWPEADRSAPPARSEVPSVSAAERALPPAASRPAAAPPTHVHETTAVPTARRRAARPTGFLNLNARPWARVVIDGKPLSEPTPVRRHPLAPGRHEVVLTGPTGQERTLMVFIKSGQTVTRVVGFE